MDKREAKRLVCGDVATSMVEDLAEGEVGLGMDPDDRARYEEGFADLAEELLRRSGVDTGPPGETPVDPRQVTIYEVLEDLDGRTA